MRAHFVFAANYGLPTPASFSKSFVSEKKSALCDGKLGPSSMLVPIVSVLNRDGKFTPRLLKQFWCSFNVSCSFGLQIFHPMMDHSIPVNIQAVVRILGFCKLSVLWSWWKIHSSFASGIFVLVDLSCPFGLHISPHVMDHSLSVNCLQLLQFWACANFHHQWDSRLCLWNFDLVLIELVFVWFALS